MSESAKFLPSHLAVSVTNHTGKSGELVVLMVFQPGYAKRAWNLVQWIETLRLDKRSSTRRVLLNKRTVRRMCLYGCNAKAVPWLTYRRTKATLETWC